MSNEKVFVRRAPRDAQHPYMQLLRKVPQDLSLTLEERGLLIYILSLPDSWIVGIEEMGKKNGIGRDKVRKIINRLKDCGYCRAERVKDEKGRYEITEYLFSEEKMEVEPVPEIQALDSRPWISGRGSLGTDDSHTYTRDTNSIDNNTNTDAASAACVGDSFSCKVGNSRAHGTNPRAIGANPRCSPSREMTLYGSHVRLRDDQHKALCAKYGADKVAIMIEEMNDYCACSRPKGYADYSAAIRQWMRRRQESGDSYSAGYKKTIVDRRTRNMDGTPVDAPHLNGLF